MLWRSPFSEKFTVKCPDGTIRIVYKNLKDAFPLHIPGWGGKMDTSIEAVKGAPANLSAEYQSKIQGLLFSLDDLNNTLMMSFRAAYVSYESNPCENSASFSRQIEKMNDEQKRLTSVKMQIRGLIMLAEKNPDHSEQVISVFLRIVDQIGGPSISTASAIEIKENRDGMKRLAGGSHES